ncbi:DNA-binding SARP family transcriptional activator [Kribbella amoyensis]|uniref:DNA-binding SARP family transcriptional activator n=1 Tax=Kribbella amoyensis TaxID=996641 RepID=A0A561BR80_9ACTN|nr:BTAD domain-containing putative transcriptional regulator [Kribbella amoyensis]TWD81371.1 DNA-binding SARP family transcriptional activator [Kribbella amoyensis]
MSGRPHHDAPGISSVQGSSARFGELLRSYRRQRNLTQRDLADRAGLSMAAIRDLEQGRTRSPKPESIQLIAAALSLNHHDTAALQDAALAHRTTTVSVASPAGALRIGILGPLEIRYGDTPLNINSGPQRTLLVRLALGAGTTVSQDELVDLLWPRGAPDNAGNLLQTRIARLRRLLESGGPTAPVITGSRAGYRLQVGSDTLDLLTFRELAAKAADDAPDAAFTGLSTAVELWRGETDVETLADHPLTITVANEYAAAVQALAALAREVGEPELALSTLRGLTSRHELDEPLHAELIQTLAAAGRQAEALAAYDRIRAALADQLGIDPGERLRAAQVAVLRQQSGAPAPPVQQAVVQQAPTAPTDFIGRVDELATISTALRRPDALSSRTVLVNGIAGVGKTALALTAAHRLRAEYPDGQLYADLRGSDAVTPAPLQVLGRFLRALGVPSRRIGTDETEAAALFRSELADRRILVLLDNAQDTAQVRPLLPGAGRSDVIVTSRRRLPELDAADVVNLEPLPRDDAVRLITSTARMLDAGTDGVAALAEACARLPLALRIAGARLATRQEWTIADLARRLDDGNRRLSELSLGESSVLNSFELSYADLGPAAQRAFRLCSLHPGDDFSGESTGILLGIPTAEADRVLEDLLEANMLLQHTKNRYRFHDLLGLYARRLLAQDSQADAARTRLYSWYAEAVTAAVDWAYPQLVRLSSHPEPERFFTSETAALSWLDDELRALLAVVEDSAAIGERELTWRIADQLRGYFLIRRDADGWLQAAQTGTAAATLAGDDVARVAMLMNRGQALWAAGRDDDSMADCLTGHALAVAVDWPLAAAYMAHQVGWLHLERGTLGEAALWMSRALEWTAADQESHVRAVALNGLGMTRLYQGELRDAADLLAAALRMNENGRATSALANRGNLASALRQLGEVDEAAALLDEVLVAYQTRSHPRGELSTLDELARLWIQRGDGAVALELAVRAHDLAIIVRDRKAQAQTAATVALAQLEYGDAGAAIEWSDACLTIARGVYPYIEADALLVQARALHTTGDRDSAVGAATQAESIAATCGFGLLQSQATKLLVKIRSGASDD